MCLYTTKFVIFDLKMHQNAYSDPRTISRIKRRDMEKVEGKVGRRGKRADVKNEDG